MNKIILPLLLGVFLFGMKPNYWFVYDTIFLKKDYFATYYIRYQGVEHILKFRFTLYKNHGIVMLYNYDKFPYQNILYDDSDLNIWKKDIVDHRRRYKDPYFLIVFKDFNGKIATFNFLVFNPEENIYVELKPKELRNRKYVKNLPDNE